jgi:bacteriocin-like protein
MRNVDDVINLEVSTITELSTEELDTVTGGMTNPAVQAFVRGFLNTCPIQGLNSFFPYELGAAFGGG